ncbi:transcriptional regulator [Fusarium mexicanum]|uniref:Transcriptional regulator n=1 Tax=Fusarium mexicanum TaxID=751941 RepID=A0A8H5JEB7_9HYPO|nr:transcriptional regulator [Fusarium mexicanum]
MTIPESNITIEPGYRPGLLARCLEMHITYYHPFNSWGFAFETSLAKSWADLIQRLINPRNQVFAAVQSAPCENSANFTQQIVGTILIDAEHLQQPNTAQIRGFIVDERARGLGVGKRLMAAAMEFIEQQKFDKVTLFTSDTQEASLYLYKKAGFVVVKDEQKILWDVPMNELQLDWTRPTAATQGVDENSVTKCDI